MKYLKLLLIGAVIIGTVYALVRLTGNGVGGGVPEPDLSSEAAQDIQRKIDALCADNAWSENGYKKIETAIQLDSNDGNISLDESTSLRDYLFAKSCLSVKEGTDKLFQQSAYPASRLAHYEGAVAFLKSKGKTNSNLAEAAKIFSAYRSIMGMLHVEVAKVSYSHPLKPFAGSKVASVKARVQSMPYYRSHFSHNSDIQSRLNRMEASDISAEQYYDQLERCVEQHYRSTHDLVALLDDQIRFNKISTNGSAKTRLNNFINNN